MNNYNILVNTYKSDNFGEKGATVIEYTLDGRKIKEAEMHFVIKSGGYASVSLAMGTQKGMAYLVEDFLKTYKPIELLNQVSNVSEMKAMYKAGLRLAVMKTFHAKFNLKESLEMLAEKQSLLMNIKM